MPADSDLQALARTRIENGTLPCNPPPSTWGGRSTGVRCELCAETIAREAIDYEVVLEQKRVAHFHMQCFSIWRLECERQKS
jgi:hypothetical protein